MAGTPSHPEPGDTYRTKCGRGRVSYHPEWSPSRPWALYFDGEAIVHTVTLAGAAAWFKLKRNATLLTEVAPT